MRFGHTRARVIFGACFLFSGIEFFTLPNLQPIGTTRLARELMLALIHSGLFARITMMEVAVGVPTLIDCGILPPHSLACR